MYGGAPPPPPASRTVSDEGLNNYLTKNGWPTGLRKMLISGLVTTPARFFICDDSGSMMSSDGNRLVGSGAQAKVIACSRWTELVETLKFHVFTANIGCAPTEFRMLNGAPAITIGASPQADESAVPIFNAVLDDYPGGGTPLCHHVMEVTKQIAALAPSLRAACKKAVLVIFTDGEASDGDIVQALKPLNDLPVWVVIRLCTDEAGIVNYWSEIDGQLELRMDVLDDPIGESKEIMRHNDWLTYGTPLHRLREFGVTAREFDLLDETSLSAEQMHKFCSLLFGVRPQDLPHPDVSFREFRDQLSALNDKEALTWSSETRAPAKWIDVVKLTARYGPPGGIPDTLKYAAASAAVHTPQWAQAPATYPAPVYSAPAPAYSAPAPVYSAPAPVYSAPAPVYSTPAPVYSTPAPVYSAPAPAYSAPAPVYSAPAPVYSTPLNPPQYTPPPANLAQPLYPSINPSYVPPPSFTAASCPVDTALVKPMASLNVTPSYPTQGSQASAAPVSAPVPDYSMMAGTTGTKSKGGIMSRLRGSK